MTLAIGQQERQTDTEIHAETVTHRHRDRKEERSRQTDRQRNRQRDKQTDRETDRQRHIDRETGRQTDRQRDRETDKTVRQTDRPCTSMTMSAPRVMRAPPSSLPLTNSTISSIWRLHFSRYCCTHTHWSCSNSALPANGAVSQMVVRQCVFYYISFQCVRDLPSHQLCLLVVTLWSEQYSRIP